MQEYFLKSYIETRAVEIANYIVENNATVRQAAKQFGISKSTVHKDITDADRLLRIDPKLAAKARHILDINKSERISAVDLQPGRSICICLMCMPAEHMDASIPALPGAQLFAHLRLFANSRPVSHNSAARHTADYLRIFLYAGCFRCHMTCKHAVQPLALFA